MGYRRGSELIHALGESETTADIRNVCNEFCGRHQFEDFLLCVRVRTVPARSRKRLIVGSTRAPVSAAKAESIVDSVLEYCAGHVTPRIPEPVRDGGATGQPDWLPERREAVCLPVHSPARVSTVLVLIRPRRRRMRDAIPAHLLPRVCLFALHLNEAVQHVLSSESLLGQSINLTEREQECLLWSAEGRTIRETASVLGITERTVVYHLQNAVKKLRAVNRCQAIARAVALGLVLPRIP